jgi:hypothetical protein
MANREDLADFVREALAAGHSRDKIEAELTGAGWSGGEVREALEAYANTGFLPPVPRPRRIVSARDFLVYALIFGSLLMFAFALGGMSFIAIDLAFGEIDVEMYDTITKAEAIENANRGMREFLAAVIVAGPVYFWMSFRELRRRRADPGVSRSAIRKWLTSVAMLVASAVLAGDLVSALGGLLNGETSAAFILKCAVVAVISGGVLLVYIRDFRNDGA